MGLSTQLFSAVVQGHQQSIDEAQIAIEPSMPSKRADYISKPKGIFHRRMFSSTVDRKRVAIIKRTPTSARLVLSRPCKGFPHRLVGAAKRHSISIRCYALCSLARAFTGMETSFQRRLKVAAKAMRGTTLITPLGLQKAWALASVSEYRGRGKLDDEDWESVGIMESNRLVLVGKDPHTQRWKDHDPRFRFAEYLLILFPLLWKCRSG
jgi:hypothetical protein